MASNSCMPHVLAVFCLYAVFAADGRTVKVSDLGFDANDATAIVQKALDSGAERVVVDRRAKPWVVGPLHVRSNTEILFEEGVQLMAKSGEFMPLKSSLVNVVCVTNVVLHGLGKGATLRMRKSEYLNPPYPKSQWRHAVNLLSAKNVRVENLHLAESGGDGVYLGVGVVGCPNENVIIRRCVCDGNNRQGISVISARHLLIEDTVMKNTCGHPPSAGIDFEPNAATETIFDCVMRNCLSERNAGSGYEFYLANLDSTSGEVSITLENCRSAGDGKGTVFYAYDNAKDRSWFTRDEDRRVEGAPRGFVRYVNCTFERSRGVGVEVALKPAGTIRASFENCMIANAATDGGNVLRFGKGDGDRPVVDDIRLENLMVRLEDDRPNWLGVDRSFITPEAVTNITGNVRIIRKGGEEMEYVFDTAWGDRNMKPRTDRRLPAHVVGDDVLWKSAVVTERRHGTTVELTRVWFPSRADYVFHAPAKGTVRFMACTRPSQARKARPFNSAALGNAITVENLDKRRICVRDAPGTDGGPVEVEIPAAGFYTLKVRAAGADFILETTTVPVAVDTRDAGGEMLFDGRKPVSFWLDVQESGSGVLVHGDYYGSCANAMLFDATGAKVKHIDVGSHWQVAYVPEGRSPGMWRLDFSPIEGKKYTAFSLDMAGSPGLFFLSPEKTWRFGTAPCAGAAEPIKWFDGTWDDSGAPRGKLISGNPRWFGERTFTEIDYEYEKAPTWLKDVWNKEFGRRLLRGPTGAPEQYPQLRTVANKDGTPIVVVFDFKRTRVLTEVDVVAERSTNATGFVEFSDDKSVWRTRTTFRHAGTITRIRFPAGALGRYMRLSVMADSGVDAKNAKDGPPRTCLDEVLVWGDPDAPTVVAGDFTEIPLGDALSFNAAAKGTVSILPMAIPHLAVKPYGRTPDEIFLTMARNETETRYFAVVNGTDVPTSVALSAPDFGKGISAELLIGGVLPVAPPKRKLSRREMVQLATNDENGINNVESGELDVLPFFFADARGDDGFRRRYLANARQVAGFPESVPLDPGQGCVVMLRVATSGAAAGRREGQLAAGAAKLPVRLNVVDLALPEQSMWIYAYRPFTQQYPFESMSRMKRDVERYAGIGATTVKYLPEPGTKERRFFRLVPQMSVGASVWLADDLHERVNKGEFDSLTKEERNAIVAGARRFLERGRALGLSDSHICAFLPDEPGRKNGKSVMRLAHLVKESVPELMIHCDPLFFVDGGFCETGTIKDSLLPEYNTFVDISCPFGAIATRKGLMEDLWLKPRAINAMYSHPAGKTGREMVYDCRRRGFNGFAYYCYYHPNGSDPWDIATWGVLNYNYQAVFPLEGDVALTPLYETLREAAEDSRMLDALKAAGKDAVLRDVLERSKTAWDRTHFQYRLKDSTAEDILSLRETILAAFAK